MTIFLVSLSSLLNGASGLINAYGLPAIFLLMVLESASLPIPSEVVIPLTGLLAAKGLFSPYLALAVLLAAGIIGMTIDYYLAYFVEKDIVYRHLRAFRIKKEHLDTFDRWFERNGRFAVFIGRMLPEVRGLVSLPAGFTKMPKRDFYLYSIAGTIIWDVALLSFGYYALNANNVYVAMVAVAIFATVIYVLYKLTVKKQH